MLARESGPPIAVLGSPLRKKLWKSNIPLSRSTLTVETPAVDQPERVPPKAPVLQRRWGPREAERLPTKVKGNLLLVPRF